MKDLSGKNAIITGASSGIGEQTAYKLARQGANIVLTSRSIQKLEEIAENIEEKYDSEAIAIETDVTREEEITRMFDKTKQEFGEVDIVVANAGLAVGDEVEEMKSEEFHKMMDVNCDGVFFTCREAIAYLKETEGNLILLGSFAGQYPRPANPVYAATKWWVRGFGLSLSAQIGNENVAVSIVNPTEVRTEFAAESGSSFAERFEEGEVTEPEDIAEAIVFAARQQKPNTVNEIDMYRRDKMEDF